MLTIDREIQRSVETILDKAVTRIKPPTARLLSWIRKQEKFWPWLPLLASTPTIIGTYGDVFTAGIPFNKAVSQVYEPGSVFKVLTMAAALGFRHRQTETEFNDTGVIEVGGWSYLQLGSQCLGSSNHGRLYAALIERLPFLGRHPDGSDHYFMIISIASVSVTAPISTSPAKKFIP